MMLEVTALRLNLPQFQAQTPGPLSFTLNKGEMLWIRGENGAGKSTLLKTIIGLVSPLSGTIDWPTGRPSLFYLGHELALVPSFTVLEYCAWHPALPQTPNQSDIRRVLGRMGLLNQAYQLCGQLSRGQQQRLLLACAQLSQAQLWLLDEPLTALDVKSRETILDTILAHKNQGGAVLIVSHTPLPEGSSEVIDVLG